MRGMSSSQVLVRRMSLTWGKDHREAGGWDALAFCTPSRLDHQPRVPRGGEALPFLGHRQRNEHKRGQVAFRRHIPVFNNALDGNHVFITAWPYLTNKRPLYLAATGWGHAKVPTAATQSIGRIHHDRSSMYTRYSNRHATRKLPTTPQPTTELY